jgi:hypothetical protein
LEGGEENKGFLTQRDAEGSAELRREEGERKRGREEN